MDRVGYVRARIYFGGRKSKNFYVHRLVAAAFHGQLPRGWFVDHINMDKGNNCPWNLEYVTRRENSLRAHASGAIKHKLSDAQVIQIRELCKAGERHGKVAMRFGVCRQMVSSIVTGKRYGRVQHAPAANDNAAFKNNPNRPGSNTVPAPSRRGEGSCGIGTTAETAPAVGVAES